MPALKSYKIVGNFLCPVGQYESFISLRNSQPKVYKELSDKAFALSERRSRQVVVILYNYNPKGCPKQATFEEFSKMKSFEMHETVPLYFDELNLTFEVITLIGKP